jgi:hypothetical protein
MVCLGKWWKGPSISNLGTTVGKTELEDEFIPSSFASCLVQSPRTLRKMEQEAFWGLKLVIENGCHSKRLTFGQHK